MLLQELLRMSWSTSQWEPGRGSSLFLQEPGHYQHHLIQRDHPVRQSTKNQVTISTISFCFFSTCRVLEDDLPEWQEMDYMLRISQPPDTCR